MITLLSNLKFKNFTLNTIIFFFLTIVFVNQIHLHLKSDVDGNSAKIIYSKELVSNDNYKSLNRECEITGEFSDRHKVRWVKSLFLHEIYLASEKISNVLPYYVNIFLHSFIIFLTLIILNKTFSLNHKYSLLFLLYITFLFQGYLSEYSYSIFEMFFLSLCLYASKNGKIFLFTISGILAVLNRESGFIILLSWLIFNKEFKKLIVVYFFIGIIFLFLNFDIIKCLINPKFFIPLENQIGHTDIHDIFEINIFSLIKIFILNFLLPFGLAFYYLIETDKVNKVLLSMLLIYLLVFIVATPLHHVSIRLLLLPLIFTSIYFVSSQRQKI
tara:strand:+ start:998 stop:1984 length:987 start_codon:yes stop_codon:yes gene_type:complete